MDTSQPPPFLPPDERLRREFEWPLVKAQSAVIAASILLGLTILFGLNRSRRLFHRFSTPWPVKQIIATVILFPGSNKLISYIPGLMEQKHKYDLFAFWLAFLTYLGAVANNYSCYRFGDNEDRRISLFMDVIFPWGTIAYSLCKDLIVTDVFVPVIIMFWMVYLKFQERRDALRYATRSSFGLMESTKVVHDFFRCFKIDDDVERGEDGVSVNNRVVEPNTSRYLVDVRDARSIFENGDSIDGEDVNAPTGSTPSRGLLGYDNPLAMLVTLDKIIDQKGKLEGILPSGEAEKLQNTCFSFALFWMLLAKVAGHDVQTDAYKELFVSPNEGSTKEDEEVKRIFDIIDTENDFLYQYFYTNYYAIYVKGLISRIWYLGIVFLFVFFTIPLFFLYRPQDHSVIYVDVIDRVVDRGITRFVILIILLVELVHIYLVLTSNWAKIIYLCDYFRSKHYRKIAEVALKYSIWLSVSFGKGKEIAQYSLAERYNTVSKMTWLAYFINELRVMDVPEDGQSGVRYVPLNQELKKSFIRFIKKSKDTNCKISNGISMLRDEFQDENLIDNYVSKLESHSEVILVWHLATHYLHLDVGSTENEEKRVATTLSKYCAYLVVFASKFLPDNGFVAQCVFKGAVKELNKSPDPHEGMEIELAKKQSSISEKRSITKTANALKDEIARNYNNCTWKLLAGFWTELLLFLALANNFETIEAHVDSLCTGGELVTHLWALLNHAGCSRDPDVRPKIKTREDE